MRPYHQLYIVKISKIIHISKLLMLTNCKLFNKVINKWAKIKVAYSVEYWLRGDFPYGKKPTPVWKRLTGRCNLLILNGLHENTRPPRRLAPARLLRRGVFWVVLVGQGQTSWPWADWARPGRPVSWLIFSSYNACIPIYGLFSYFYFYVTARNLA